MYIITSKKDLPQISFYTQQDFIIFMSVCWGITAVVTTWLHVVQSYQENSYKVIQE